MSPAHDSALLESVERERGPAWDLPALVSALRDARGVDGAAAADSRVERRPSRTAVVAIVRDLHAALFPAHLGVSDFADNRLDFFVGNTLDASLRALQDQLQRSFAAEQSAPAQASQRAYEVVQAFARELPAIRSTLENDLRAAFDGDPAAKSRAEILLCYPGVRAITYHRLAHPLYRLGATLLARIISEASHADTAIDIHPGAQIGPEFFIDHGTGVVIGETAIIGRRVRLYQGVTLGAKNFPTDENHALVKGLPRHPIVEDDVVIYSGATVLGRITIGAGSTIGGNVWLTHSVPPNSRVTQAKTRSDALFDEGAGI